MARRRPSTPGSHPKHSIYTPTSTGVDRPSSANLRVVCQPNGHSTGSYFAPRRKIYYLNGGWELFHRRDVKSSDKAKEVTGGMDDPHDLPRSSGLYLLPYPPNAQKSLHTTIK